jgi:hypothetical protein
MFRKTKIMALLGATALMLLTAVSAFAAVVFHDVSATINNQGALVVSFDASGLGNVEDALATLTADATAQWGCFNRGGNHPQASNKETVNATVEDQQTVPVHNGRASGTLSAGAPPPGGLNCPGNQVLRLMNVTYSNIVLTVDTGTINLGTRSRIFIAE